MSKWWVEEEAKVETHADGEQYCSHKGVDSLKKE